MKTAMTNSSTLHLTKAYQIDLSKISEGFAYSPIFCYAENLNKAKSELLGKIKYEGMELLYGKDEITYLNIPVIRYEEADLHEFEGEYITKNEIDRIQQKRKRLEYFQAILDDESVSHCYIRKGSYYRPRAAGYTSYLCFAGIYTKEEAIQHGKSCNELQIIPIDTAEHNKMIEEEIKELQSRIII